MSLFRAKRFRNLVTVAVACSLASFALAQSKKGTDDKNPPNLTHQIRHQLLTLPYYSVFDFVAFTLDGSKVTLTGQVVRPTLKTDAEGSVKSLEGVVIVANNIEVLPASPTDDELRRAVYRAIYEDATLARYAIQLVPPIHIIVKNRTVALEGVVDSAADKNLAAARAGSVANVLSIKNNLLVQPKATTAQ
jgi:hyperosmotically inducible protein